MVYGRLTASYLSHDLSSDWFCIERVAALPLDRSDGLTFGGCSGASVQLSPFLGWDRYRVGKTAAREPSVPTTTTSTTITTPPTHTVHKEAIVQSLKDWSSAILFYWFKLLCPSSSLSSCFAWTEQPSKCFLAVILKTSLYRRWFAQHCTPLSLRILLLVLVVLSHKNISLHWRLCQDAGSILESPLSLSRPFTLQSSRPSWMKHWKRHFIFLIVQCKKRGICLFVYLTEITVRWYSLQRLKLWCCITQGL